MPEFVAYVGAPQNEADRLREAVQPDQPAPAVQLNGETAEVHMAFGAPSSSEACMLMVRTYASLRADAGLDPAEPLYGFVGPASA
jgi:hypothetical protein